MALTRHGASELGRIPAELGGGWPNEQEACQRQKLSDQVRRPRQGFPVLRDAEVPQKANTTQKRFAQSSRLESGGTFGENASTSTPLWMVNDPPFRYPRHRTSSRTASDTQTSRSQALRKRTSLSDLPRKVTSACQLDDLDTQNIIYLRGTAQVRPSNSSRR